MHPEILELAASRAVSDDDRQRLRSVATVAHEHKAVANAFEADINASKAARGEPPTILGRGRRAQLQAFSQDAERGHRELLELLAPVETGRAIIEIVLPAMEQDVAFWEQSHRHVHAGDMPVVAALTRAKVALRDAMADYLRATGAVDEPGEAH